MKKRLIVFLLIVGVSTTSFLVDSNVYAVTKKENEQKIQENKEKIDNLKKEKNQINKDRDKSNDELEKVLGEIDAQGKIVSESEANVRKYQQKVDDLNNQIGSLNNKIDQINQSIKGKEDDIRENQKRKEENQKLLDGRLREYYKSDMNSMMLKAIFDSRGMGELISNVYTMNKIIETDNKLIKEAKELDKQLKEDKIILDSEKQNLDIQKQNVEKMKKEQVDLKEKAEKERDKQKAELDKLEGLESQKREVLGNMGKKESNINEEITDLESYNKELQQEIDKLFEELNNGGTSSNNGSSSNSGSTNNGGSVGVTSRYIRPTSGVVTSSYGPRIHPIKGQVGFHTGVDIGAGYGTPIKAAASGTVVVAGWVSGYGKTVIIDHGNGEQTLYGHTSSYNVSAGQTVKQGEVIAHVGSTGNSTGPHLHWEIRKNGQHVSPMAYV